MPLNGLRSIHPKLEDYANLEVVFLIHTVHAGGCY